MSSSSLQTALVTGANKGIGFAIVETLIKEKSNNLRVLLGARDKERGNEALKEIKSKHENANVEFIHIDIDDENTIKQAAEEVRQKYGGLDILINNAGMAFKGDRFDEEVAKITFHTNYWGTLHTLNYFLPLIKKNGRIVNVSSMMSRNTLNRMSEELRNKFMNDNLTIEQLNELMNQFVSDVKDGNWEKNGWPKSAYGVSKVGVSMLTRIMSKKLNDGIVMNCCCPGWVRTDMAGPRAPKTPEEGAVTPVYCSLLPVETNAPNGQFFEDKMIKSYL